jgi:hypothetical protein
VAVDDVVIGRAVAGSTEEIRLAVLDGGIQGLGAGRPSAERIAAAAPVGARGVFVLGDSWGKPVAFESLTGQLVAFAASMDGEVARFTTTTLAKALADSIAR